MKNIERKNSEELISLLIYLSGKRAEFERIKKRMPKDLISDILEIKTELITRLSYHQKFANNLIK